MDTKHFEAVLTVIIARLVNIIIVETGLSEDEAIEQLYASKLYGALEFEETKVWQYSVPMLYELYKSEAASGELSFPDY